MDVFLTGCKDAYYVAGYFSLLGFDDRPKTTAEKADEGSFYSPSLGVSVPFDLAGRWLRPADRPADCRGDVLQSPYGRLVAKTLFGTRHRRSSGCSAVG